MGSNFLKAILSPVEGEYSELHKRFNEVLNKIARGDIDQLSTEELDFLDKLAKIVPETGDSGFIRDVFGIYRGYSNGDFDEETKLQLIRKHVCGPVFAYRLWEMAYVRASSRPDEDSHYSRKRFITLSLLPIMNQITTGSIPAKTIKSLNDVIAAVVVINHNDLDGLLDSLTQVKAAIDEDSLQKLEESLGRVWAWMSSDVLE